MADLTSFTADSLVAAVKRDAMLPGSELTFSDQDIVDMANSELRGWLVPLILQRQETMYLTFQDFVVGTGRSYRIPSRALFSRLYDLNYIDASGSETPLTWFSESELNGDGQDSLGYGYTLRGPMVVLSKYAPTSGTLRMYYRQVPNKIVLVGSLVQTNYLASFQAGEGPGTNKLSLAAPVLTTGFQYDIIQAGSPHLILQPDLTVVSSSPVGGKTEYVFDQNISSDVAAGDIVMASGTSWWPQVPDEVYSLLCQQVLVKVLTDLEQLQSAGVEAQKLNAMLPTVLDQLTPRVTEQPRIISSTELTQGY